jgi:DNA-binding NarL/FixJ family response regulator
VSARKIQPPIHLLIAEANAMLCELLRGALRRRRAFRVVGCEVTVREFLAAAQSESIDVALVGAHLQDGAGSGLHAIQLLRAARPDIRAIILLQRFEKNLVAEAFRVGARGVFFRSQHHLDVLLKCISRVHAGQIWASTSDLEQMVEALRQHRPLSLTNAQGMKLLSKQESKIARLISEGMPNREIAAQLGLSGHTVKNYLFKIFDKLGISNRVELALYVATHDNAVEFEAEETPPSSELKEVG